MRVNKKTLIKATSHMGVSKFSHERGGYGGLIISMCEVAEEVGVVVARAETAVGGGGDVEGAVITEVVRPAADCTSSPTVAMSQTGSNETASADENNQKDEGHQASYHDASDGPRSKLAGVGGVRSSSRRSDCTISITAVRAGGSP